MSYQASAASVTIHSRGIFVILLKCGSSIWNVWGLLDGTGDACFKASDDVLSLFWFYSLLWYLALGQELLEMEKGNTSQKISLVLILRFTDI